MPATMVQPAPQNQHSVANMHLTLNDHSVVAPGQIKLFDQLLRVNVEVQTDTGQQQTESQLAALGLEETLKRAQTYNYRAAQALREYTLWYRGYADLAERNLQTARTPKPRRIRYAREQGLRKLAGLAELINVHSEDQLSTVIELLEGFQELGTLTAVPGDQAVFLVRAVEDVVARLNNLGLLKQRSSGLGITLRRSVQTGPVAA